MRIATFNINGVRARLPRLLEWLDESQPDVACLQEVKAEDADAPLAELRRAGYHVIWHGQKGFNGVALLTRHTAAERRRGLPGDAGDTQARFLEVEVNGLVVACLYLPNGNPAPGPKFDYKLAWMDRLRNHATALLRAEREVILCGDFNVVPADSDSNAHQGDSLDALVRPESRSRFRALLSDGWTDSLSVRNPGGGPWTYWDYQMNAWPRDVGFRIDHLLLSPAASDRLLDAGVDRAMRGMDKASDHAPAWVELRD